MVSSADLQDASGGIYFYGKRNPGFEHKIRLSKTPREGDWDFVIDIDNGYLGGRGFGIFFSADLAEYLSKFNEYVDITCSKLLIGTGRNLRQAGIALEKTMTANKVAVTVMDIRENAALRELLVSWEDGAFCAIGAGTEQEMTSFIPKVRQYMVRNDQRVYVLEDTFSGRQLDDNYRSYFYSTRFFPVFDLYFSDDVSIFAGEYKDFSGLDLTYKSLLGYEMLHFIHALVLGEATEEDFFTGILGVQDGKVRRQLQGYFVNNRGKVDALKVKLPPLPEETGIGGEE